MASQSTSMLEFQTKDTTLIRDAEETSNAVGIAETLEYQEFPQAEATPSELDASVSEEASVPEIDPDTEYEYDSEDIDIIRISDLQEQMKSLFHALLSRMLKFKIMEPATDSEPDLFFKAEIANWIDDVRRACDQMNTTVQVFDEKGVNEAIDELANLIVVMSSCVDESDRISKAANINLSEVNLGALNIGSTSEK
ncbi:hypothetical protein N7495_009547 [Penicillium taxi]|uniref:uncharacterized protein n=1 Tax=Penicillium taxi TaxID=168475 RepID=UPI0025452DDB|nr:uncharacterized protein N7495_009547 [Penicillium taxi]KAJ5885037.1 hypothetical protein N7495_009547 [Penicillium taxi]